MGIRAKAGEATADGERKELVVTAKRNELDALVSCEGCSDKDDIHPSISTDVTPSF